MDQSTNSPLSGFSPSRINSLFVLFVMCNWMLGVCFGCYNSYYTPMLKKYGLSNSQIELLLIGTATGGFTSGLIYDFLLKRVNKEAFFLSSMVLSCVVNFIFGFILYFDSLMNNTIAIWSVIAICLYLMGLGRSGVINFALTFAAEAYPDQAPRRISVISGAFLIGMFSGPVLEYPLYYFFEVSGLYFTNSLVFLAIGVILYTLVPKYPPSLQKEKNRSLDGHSELVEVTNTKILKHGVVFSFFSLLMIAAMTQKIVISALPLYFVDEFDLSSFQQVLIINSVYCFGSFLILLDYFLLKILAPLGLTYILALVGFIGSILCFLNLLIEENNLPLSIIGACLTFGGTMFFSFAGPIAIDLTSKSLNVETNHVLRDKVINIYSSIIFLSYLSSIQLSIESLLVGFEIEMLIQGVLTFSVVTAFFVVYSHFNMHKRKEIVEI